MNIDFEKAKQIDYHEVHWEWLQDVVLTPFCC